MENQNQRRKVEELGEREASAGQGGSQERGILVKRQREDRGKDQPTGYSLTLVRENLRRRRFIKAGKPCC